MKTVELLDYLAKNADLIYDYYKPIVAELKEQANKYKELNEYHALQYELASEDADRLQKQLNAIIRCRDCKHLEMQTVSYSKKPLSICTAEWCEGAEGDNPLVEPDGFCAWGERKD